MKRYIRRYAIFFILAVELSILSFEAMPVGRAGKNFILNSSLKNTAGDNIILLMDNSGSMRTTDHNGLSAVAASMLMDTLESGDNINIIAFGDKVQAPYRLKDKPSIQALKNTLSMLNYKDNNTNLKDGLNEALNQLDEVSGTKSIIVLSDGKEEPMGGMTKGHEDELNSLIDRAYNSKVKIHTIGLSSLADEEMLSRVSYRTGGTYFFCDNPGELFDTFGKIIGNTRGYYTVDKYITSVPGEKTINFSAFIEEIIIKTASTENRIPKVEISGNGKDISADKYSERYKIFKIKGGTNTSIRIRSLDSSKNIVIVQMKSRAGLKVDIPEGSFQIPYKIPVDINCSLDLNEIIQGLHMDMIISQKREPLIKTEDNFIFRYIGDAPGQYSGFITAYDGSNNIITVRNIDINVTDNPPFYYTDRLPQVLMIRKPMSINLQQVDKTPVKAVSGEIVADYGEEKETIPLINKDGRLSADLTFKKVGKVKLLACINGIYNNQSFSYYLPQSVVTVVERPFLELAAVKTSGMIKKGEAYNLELQIKDSLLYKEESILVYDNSGQSIGSFTAKENQQGKIAVKIKPIEQCRSLTLYFKGSEEVKLTDEIDTKVKVVTNTQYFLYKNWFGIAAAAVIACITGAAAFLGWYTYKTKVVEYKVVKDLYYRVNGKVKTLNIELSVKKCPLIFINIRQDCIYELDREERAIGYFQLRWPRKSRILIGLLYIIKGKSIFEVSYNAILDQILLVDDMEENTPVSYRDDLIIKFKDKNMKYEIQFQ